MGYFSYIHSFLKIFFLTIIVLSNLLNYFAFILKFLSFIISIILRYLSTLLQKLSLLYLFMLLQITSSFLISLFIFFFLSFSLFYQLSISTKSHYNTLRFCLATIRMIFCILNWYWL